MIPTTGGNFRLRTDVTGPSWEFHENLFIEESREEFLHAMDTIIDRVQASLGITDEELEEGIDYSLRQSASDEDQECKNRLHPIHEWQSPRWECDNLGSAESRNEFLRDMRKASNSMRTSLAFRRITNFDAHRRQQTTNRDWKRTSKLHTNGRSATEYEKAESLKRFVDIVRDPTVQEDTTLPFERAYDGVVTGSREFQLEGKKGYAKSTFARKHQPKTKQKKGRKYKKNRR
jgi:hypothetical protein